ncbi:MAG: hypothetical protein C3F11_09475 [Methylocystaceae bacterium]|nr:MAG: hypothetical protein C3F11_09475 [Methylocystaceae bacterium]
MARTNLDRDNRLGETPLEAVERLRQKFIVIDRDRQLEHAFNHLHGLLTIRHAQRQNTPVGGPHREARALVVVGGSGAGKTRSIRRLFEKHPALTGFGTVGSGCPLVSITAPSPCTLRQLGRATLWELGYPIERSDLKEYRIWELVRRQIRSTGATMIHFDEMQHVTQVANVVERQKVANTLKSLMVDPEWPVSLILSGIDDLIAFIESDPQLRRRASFLRFEPLAREEHAAQMIALASDVVGTAGLGLKVDSRADLGSRLLHAASYQFGIMIDLILEAIYQALVRLPPTVDHDDRYVDIDDFAHAYAARTGCGPAANPFLTPDWEEIDVGRVLANEIVRAPTEPPVARSRSKKRQNTKRGW